MVPRGSPRFPDPLSLPRPPLEPSPWWSARVLHKRFLAHTVKTQYFWARIFYIDIPFHYHFFCHLIFTQLLLIIVQTLCTISVLLNLSKVNLPYIISILLLRHGLQTWRSTRGNFGSVSTALHDLSIAGIIIFSAFWIFSHDT